MLAKGYSPNASFYWSPVKQNQLSHFEMGKKFIEEKNYESALKCFSTAIEENPQDFKAYCNKGMIYKILNNEKQAEKAYSQCLKLQSNDKLTLFNYANLLRAQGDNKSALAMYQDALKSTFATQEDIEYDILINIGICYKNMKKYQEAIQYFNQATNVNSLDEASYFNRSMCYLDMLALNPQKNRSELISEAKNSLDIVKTINPENHKVDAILIEIMFEENPSEEKGNQCLKKLRGLKGNQLDSNSKQFVNFLIEKFEVKIGEKSSITTFSSAPEFYHFEAK